MNKNYLELLETWMATYPRAENFRKDNEAGLELVHIDLLNVAELR